MIFCLLVMLFLDKFLTCCSRFKLHKLSVFNALGYLAVRADAESRTMSSIGLPLSTWT